MSIWWSLDANNTRFQAYVTNLWNWPFHLPHPHKKPCWDRLARRWQWQQVKTVSYMTREHSGTIKLKSPGGVQRKCTILIWAHWLLMCGFPWNPHSFLGEVSAKVFDCFVPKHTQRQKHFHVSIALFDSRVGCHSSVRGDNTLYLELVNALIEQINVTSKLYKSQWQYIYESMTIGQSYWESMKLGLQGRTRQDSLVSRLSKLVGRTNFISFHKVVHSISYKICREYLTNRINRFNRKNLI